MERFKTEILNLAQPDESQWELMELFWRELPPSKKELYLTPLNFKSVDEVLLEALKIATITESDDNMSGYTLLD